MNVSSFKFQVSSFGAGQVQAFGLLLLLLLVMLSFPAPAQERPTPIATTNRVGTVKPDGSTITILPDGTISSSGGGGSTNGITQGQFTAGLASGTNTFKGAFTEKDSFVTGTANPYRIGFNTGIGTFVAGSTAGQETLFELYSPWANLLFGPKEFASFYNGSTADYTFRFYKAINTLPGFNVAGTLGNQGAQQTTYAPDVGGSAGSMVNLPVPGHELMHAAMPKPWLGTLTSDPQAVASAANPVMEQTNYYYLTNMAIYFNTSGIASALSPYGVRPNIWGDAGWEATNRTAQGSLQVFPGMFPDGVSNTLYYIHTNGSTLTLHIYQTTRIPNQFPADATTADTAYRFDISGANPNSYPSAANTSTVTYTYPAITGDTVPIDILWFYTNGIDGVMSADDTTTEVQGYEHYRLTADADAILYPATKNSGRVWWRNYTFPNGAGDNGILDPASFPAAPQLNHQLWLGYFANHASAETPYYANFIAPDQAVASIGSLLSISRPMIYAQTYNQAGMSNWVSGTFPFFAITGQDAAWKASDYTNWYSVVGEFNACSGVTWNTNTTWNTNQNIVATNANFLSAWSDVAKFPTQIINDNTNSLWVRKLSDGFVVLAVDQNNSAATNFNASLVVAGGIGSNVIYCATNIFSQTAYGSGLLTNNFIGTVGATNLVWVKLTPSSGSSAGPVTFADNTNGAIFELDASTIAGHSDGDMITNWTGNYSAQATNIGTAGNGPPQYKTGILNGLPILRLYGTNRLVSANTFGAISDTNLTVFIVAKHNLNPSLSVLLSCNGVKFYYGRTTPDCRIWNMQNLSPQTSKVGYSFLPWTNTTYTVTLDCIVYDGTTVLCGDGLNMIALPNSGTIGMGSNPMEIGALGGSFNFTGDIGFIRIYTNTDPAIRIQAALHIAQTWGVNITNIPANIVVNGDSTAFGNGLSAGQDPAACLTNVLAAQWRTGNFYTENRGVGGQTFSNRLVLISDDIARIVPGGETIDLHLEGINDISAGMTSSNLEANVKLYGTQYRAAGGWFIPQKLIPRGDAGFTSTMESNRLAFNAAIGTNFPQYADGVFDNSVLMPTSVTNTTVYMQADKIHPTFTANKMLAVEEAKQIKKLDNKGALR